MHNYLTATIKLGSTSHYIAYTYFARQALLLNRTAYKMCLQNVECPGLSPCLVTQQCYLHHCRV